MKNGFFSVRSWKNKAIGTWGLQSTTHKYSTFFFTDKWTEKHCHTAGTFRILNDFELRSLLKMEAANQASAETVTFKNPTCCVCCWRRRGATWKHLHSASLPAKATAQLRGPTRRTPRSTWKHFHTASYSEGEKCDLQIPSNETGISKRYYDVQTHPVCQKCPADVLFCFIFPFFHLRGCHCEGSRVQRACLPRRRLCSRQTGRASSAAASVFSAASQKST